MEMESDLTDLSDEYTEGPPKKTAPRMKPGDYKLTDVIKLPRTTTTAAESLYKWIHSGDVELEPEYQRDVVWPETKQIKLIDSILRNYYIPPVIFRVIEDDDHGDKRICIDGKQRLTSLQRFMDGLIPHQDSETKKKYWFKSTSANQKRPLLPEYLKKQFLQKQIICIEYRDLHETWEREIFQRVQMGMPLQAAERMAAHTSPWAIFAGELKNTYLGPDCDILKHVTYDTSRARDFLTMAQILMGIFSLPDRVYFTSQSLDKWLKRTDAPTTSVREEMHGVMDKMVEVMAELHGQRVSPVEFVMIAILIHQNRDVELPGLVKFVTMFRRQLKEKYQDLRINQKVIKTAWDILDQLPGGKVRSKRKQPDDDDDEYHGSPITKTAKPATTTRAQAIKTSKSPSASKALISKRSAPPTPTIKMAPSQQEQPLTKPLPSKPIASSSKPLFHPSQSPAPHGLHGPSTKVATIGLDRLRQLSTTANERAAQTPQSNLTPATNGVFTPAAPQMSSAQQQNNGGGGIDPVLNQWFRSDPNPNNETISPLQMQSHQPAPHNGFQQPQTPANFQPRPYPPARRM